MRVGRLLCTMTTVTAAALLRSLPPMPMNARRLILVRHGAVDRAAHDPPIKPGSLYGGNLEVPLSDRGQAEAVAAAKVIAEYAESEQPNAIQFVASSPMRRAYFGADQIASAIQPFSVGRVSIAKYEALREIDRGDWVGLTRDEISAKYGEDAFERSAREDDFGRTFNGEGMGDLRTRVLDAREFILGKVREGSAAVVVSHMWVTRVMVADAIGEPDVLSVDIPTASISVIDYGPGTWPPALVEEGLKPDVPMVGMMPYEGGDGDMVNQ